MQITYNHNETVLVEDPRARLGAQLNHNETVLVNRAPVPGIVYNHNETVIADRAPVPGVDLGNHNETVVPGLMTNHNETVVPGMNLGNHNETVLADRPLLPRAALALAVPMLVGGLLGFGSSPGVISSPAGMSRGVASSADGVGGSPGGVVLAATACSSGKHLPDVDLV